MQSNSSKGKKGLSRAVLSHMMNTVRADVKCAKLVLENLIHKSELPKSILDVPVSIKKIF